jgi:hypothetical protein
LLGGDDDATVFDFPHRAVENYGLHGRYSGLPARLAGYGVTWINDEAVIWAEGEVAQIAVFGEQLRLTRRIEVSLGGSSLRIKDEVTNIGPTRCPHMFLYHCNVGFPVVDDGAELVYPAGSGVPVSDARIEEYRMLTGPQSPYVEQCYEHDMITDVEGWVTAGVMNLARGIGVFQRYRKDQLPQHITWRQLGRGTYVVAMEPSTNHDAGRLDARERNELVYLEPGEVRRYDLEIGAVVGSEVENFASSITRWGASE